MKDNGTNEAVDGIKRRDFLKILSASFAALSAGGCKLRPPKEKIVPHLDLPEGVVPGLAQYYASTCSACTAACGTLVKSRDGRPIKLEGNPEHPLSRGGLCARGQAVVLDLYDSKRLKGPLIGDKPASWDEIDAEIGEEFTRLRNEKGGIRLVTQTLTSPAARAAADEFLKQHPRARHIVYDPLSASALLDAHKLAFGRRVLPSLRFNKARTIVSFDADFLGTWISPVEFTKDWAANRHPEKEWDLMSWHAQYEARMSLTGANADLRVPLKPSEIFAAVSSLAAHIAAGTGHPAPFAAARNADASWRIEETAAMLLREKGRSLVVSGSNDLSIQLLTAWINHVLGNYGAALDLGHISNRRAGNDDAMDALISDMSKGSIDALIVWGANPAYDHPRAADFIDTMKKVGLTISLAPQRDETAVRSNFLCPDSHSLESWGDAEPEAGIRSLIQPVLAPLFSSRPAIESLLKWAGRPQSAYDFVRDLWKKDVFPRQKEEKSFAAYWDASVRRGVVELPVKTGKTPAFKKPALAHILPPDAKPAHAFELAVYPSVALAEGAQANNPWLQELPDPVTKACWGNYASFSPEDAARMDIVEGRVVRLAFADRAVELPAHIQQGMARGVVAAALGYGRKSAGDIAANYPMEKMFPVEKDLLGGADMYPLARVPGVNVTRGDRMSPLAKTQRYERLTDPLTGHRRPHVQETTLRDYIKDPKSGSRGSLEPGPSLWPRHEYKGRKWAMAIDLNACSGCAACVVACQAENNVPVVGKAEIRKYRDMHWIRIDRYYDRGEDGSSPDTAFQPMLCQQCDNAPCETVCPVLATVHSSEGLNMQVYNRCVGTRYCANNCPYKVRRFNWFDYAHNDLLQNMALNPDITVRSRGVMEKCTFCVQRIQEAKGLAKREDRQVADQEAKPACMQTCPADAIIFGDINDPESRIAKAVAGPRSYTVLGEIGVGPSVFYQTKVRNKKV